MALSNRFHHNSRSLSLFVTDGISAKGFNIFMLLLLLSPFALYNNRNIFTDPSYIKHPIGIMIIFDMILVIYTLPTFIFAKESVINTLLIDCPDLCVPELELCLYHPDDAEGIMQLIDVEFVQTGWVPLDSGTAARIRINYLILTHGISYGLFVNGYYVRFTYAPSWWSRLLFLPSTLIIRPDELHLSEVRQILLPLED